MDGGLGQCSGKHSIDPNTWYKGSSNCYVNLGDGYVNHVCNASEGAFWMATRQREIGNERRGHDRVLRTLCVFFISIARCGNSGVGVALYGEFGVIQGNPKKRT